MSSETLANVLGGPFQDLRRLIVGSVTPPPPTRKLAASDLAAARAVLTTAGCDLSRCTGENLHTVITPLPPAEVFDLAAQWALWPRSAFFACPTRDAAGASWFSYRFYGALPIVVMRLKTAVAPQYIIYDLVSGIGAGGYHAFLLAPQASGGTAFSIFTIFPPTLFLTGLHDQTNLDIFQKLNAIAAARGRHV